MRSEPTRRSAGSGHAPLDPALVRLIEALARAAARKDHAAERDATVPHPAAHPDDRRDLRPLLV